MNVEYDLKEILTRIESKIDKLTADVAEIRTDLASTKAELKGDIGRVDAEVKGEIKALGAKVDGLTSRVDTQEFINRGVIVGLLLAVLGGFAKAFGWIGRNY